MSTDKQLSDEDISEIMAGFYGKWQKVHADFARAVIEADRQLQPEPLTLGISEEEIDFLTRDGFRSANGGIYESRVYEFARRVEALVLSRWAADRKLAQGVPTGRRHTEKCNQSMRDNGDENCVCATAAPQLAQPRGEDWAIDALVSVCGALNKGDAKSALKAARNALWSHAAPQAAVPAENSERQSAALVGEPFLPKYSPGHSV